MKDAKLADVISAFPESAALAGIRAYILYEGLNGNLGDAARAFEFKTWCSTTLEYII